MSLLGAEDWSLFTLAQITKYWTGVDANSSIVADAGRCPDTFAFRNTSAVGAGCWIGVVTANAGGYVHFAYKPEGFNVTQNFYIRNGAGDVLAFARILADGSVDFWKGPNTSLGTVIGATPAGLMALNEWGSIGLEWKFDAATGYAKIFINKGYGEAADYSSGSVNTTNIWTSGQWRQVYFAPIGYVTDQYWGDLAGAAPWNAYLGDSTVHTDLPLDVADGGGGFVQGWTPSAGTDHGALVNEVPPDDGTTYVEALTVDLEELFIFPDIPLVDHVWGVMWMACATKTDAGGASIKSLVRSAATNAAGTAQSIALGDYLYYVDMQQVNPVSAVTYTATTVNAAQGGFKSA